MMYLLPEFAQKQCFFHINLKKSQKKENINFSVNYIRYKHYGSTAGLEINVAFPCFFTQSQIRFFVFNTKQKLLDTINNDVAWFCFVAIFAQFVIVIAEFHFCQNVHEVMSLEILGLN